MRVIRAYGASDDLFEVEGGPNDIEATTHEDGGTSVKIVDASGTGLLVVGQYSPNNDSGCWAIGISQIEEGALLPPWPMRYELAPSNGFRSPQPYSVMLVIETPDDVTVRVI